MTQYLKVDSRKITFREYWNLAPSWKVLIPWVAKLLRIQMRFGSGTPVIESVKQLEVDLSSLPSETIDRLQPLIEEALSAGFEAPRYFLLETLRRETRTTFAALRHRTGQHSIRLMNSASMQVHPPISRTITVILSRLANGGFFFTSDQKPTFRSPPNVLSNHVAPQSPREMLKRHQERLSELTVNGPALAMEDDGAMDELWDAYETTARDFGIARGLYVMMSPEDVAAEQAALRATENDLQLAPPGGETARTQPADEPQRDTKSAAAGDDSSPGRPAPLSPAQAFENEILMELQQLLNKRPQWTNILVVFVVSLALFLVAGSTQWSWSFVALLVPILFIHELGHFLAMRAFGYRNLRMFFIPFFGAAVTGRHFNVPGWKKVIVSLMGPTPGIVLGIFAGTAGLMLDQPFWIRVGLVSIVVNGFNMLPFMPLDGGWICHALLFSRRPLLDTSFRVLGAVGLVAWGARSGSMVLIYLSALMVMGIQASHRLATLTASLRSRGIELTSTDAQTIPQDTARSIIRELLESNARPKSAKLAAQQALQIFETLNTTAPGWATTLLLLAVYAASIGFAVIFALVFMTATLKA
ncbi:MAG: site-2 protease family protein [Verrucomicrobia bacterium]|nr:site-2 protease family protein [Verrucomicrobiota bacterium]